MYKATRYLGKIVHKIESNLHVHQQGTELNQGCATHSEKVAALYLLAEGGFPKTVNQKSKNKYVCIYECVCVHAHFNKHRALLE